MEILSSEPDLKIAITWVCRAARWLSGWHVALSEDLSLVLAPTSAFYNCLELKLQKNVMPRASEGICTHVSILTHTYTQEKITTTTTTNTNDLFTEAAVNISSYSVSYICQSQPCSLSSCHIDKQIITLGLL